jgi:hypothetical protein
MTSQTLDTLARSGQASIRPEKMTLTQKFDLAVKALENQGDNKLRALRQVEYGPLSELRARTTAGTVLQPIVEAFAAHNISATDPNHGFVMDELSLTRNALHLAFCECIDGVEITGKIAARRLRGQKLE